MEENNRECPYCEIKMIEGEYLIRGDESDTFLFCEECNYKCYPEDDIDWEE